MGWAIFLEICLSGTGFMYGGSIGKGFLILVVSIVGYIFYLGMFRAMCLGSFDFTTGTCTTLGFFADTVRNLDSGLQLMYIGGILLWLILRIVGVVRVIRRYNGDM
ncbi:MAG TPA: hypothetical protein DHW02_01580 [Ktedonobacter sp.]|nr:hypothetical protein [Ktedonobacter sp.]